MANSETSRSRAPRGTMNVTDAFFAALNELPELRRAEVAKAAQLAIRDSLKLTRDKAKAAKVAARTRVAPAAKKAGAKAAAVKTAALKKTVAKMAAPATKKPASPRKSRTNATESV
jgi:hypothetical protein